MISAILLVVFCTTVGTWGAAALTRANWTSRAPRLAIAAWQALASSVLLGLAAAGAALSIGFQHVRGDLATLLDLCAETLAHGYASPSGAVLATLGVAILGLIVTRVAWCGFRNFKHYAGERRTKVAALDMVGRTDVLPGVLVLEHDTPFAFCVGGRRHRVVVTNGLISSLDETELRAVLAHEAAHLRQRHHLALLLCQTLFDALKPVFPAFRTAMPEVRLLTELSADDCARRRVGSGPLRSALMRLTCLPAPPGTLAASALGVEVRLVRLTDPESGLPRHRSVATSLTIAALVLLPLALATAPAFAMAWEGMCLIG